MEPSIISEDDHIDDSVDDEIAACLALDSLKSFFLFAGAGSGKTRSLVKALDSVREYGGNILRLRGQRIGVVTYTNAACDEIERRIGFDPLIEASTIHSFVWSLIGSHHSDIKGWLKERLQNEIAELQAKQLSGKPGSKAAADRVRRIASYEKRLANLGNVKRFTYSPNGDNFGRDALNHAEVLKIGANFLLSRPAMQDILTTRFPILLIDESQDTIKEFMDALLQVERQHKGNFSLGLIGDTMQQIYGHGKKDLGRHLPPDWATPKKQMNHRCPQRVVELINKIRLPVDGQRQLPRSDAEEGVVRMFVLPSGTSDKPKAEQEIAQRMAKTTGDALWYGPDADIKALILEHHMAAKRLGFLEMFEPLYGIDNLRTGLRDGTLPGLRFFTELVLPLVTAKRAGNDFAATAVVRKYSPLLSKAALKASGDNQDSQIAAAHGAVVKLMSLWSVNQGPSFGDVLSCVEENGLFEIPEILRSVLGNRDVREVDASNDEDMNREIDAWEGVLRTPFQQIEGYTRYVKGLSPYGTHQGIKGLEFPRVMVIIDDSEAGGFTFSYEKLFGAAESKKRPSKEQEAGEANAIGTRRLFYVTCSRAEKSLAVVAYTAKPQAVRDHVLSEGWFKEEEVEVFT